MSDSPQLLREANSVLDELDQQSQAPTPQTAQRRRSQRQPCRIELMLDHPLGDQMVRTWALTRDVSDGALGCILRQPVPVGTPVWLFLPLLAGGTERASGLVKRRQELPSGWYWIGIVLDRSIDPARYVKPAG